MPVRTFDPQLLRTFVTVVETGSMTRASRVLHLTQGAVSQHIKRLEAQIGTALLLRGRPGLACTEAGDRLFDKARRLLALNDSLWLDMTTPLFKGRVALGIPIDLIAGRLPSLLRLFAEAYPDIDIALQCGTSPELRAAFEAGALDVTLLEEPVERATGAVLYRDRLVWVGARGGSAHHLDPLPLSLVSRSCAFRPRVIKTLQRVGRRWKNVYESDSLEATVAMMRMDLAVGTFLTSAMPGDVAAIRDGDLPSLPAFSVTLSARQTAPNHPATALSDHLTRGFSTV